MEVVALQRQVSGELENDQKGIRQVKPGKNWSARPVVLAYRIIRALKQAWKDIDLTVEEGLQELDRICAMHLSVKGGTCLRIPEPSPMAKELLNALDVKLPLMLPNSIVDVDTKKKLTSRRKK